MTSADVLLLVKKIVIGVLLALVPFLIFYGTLWLVSRFG